MEQKEDELTTAVPTYNLSTQKAQEGRLLLARAKLVYMNVKVCL